MPQTTTPSPAAEPKPTPAKISVVTRQHPLTAVRHATGGGFELEDGRHLVINPGDWLITRGKAIIDVVADSKLRERYQVIDPSAASIPASVCLQIESTLGIGATHSPERLLAAVERLATIKIGEIRIDFTPGQLEEIATRAKKRNQTVQQAMQAVVDRIREELFWRS